MNNLTLEEFENGIKLYQDENLYKFTSDAIKLAKFCKPKSSDNVLDMCAGNGVVGLYAYSVHKFNKIYFNEIQQLMCDLIDKNIKLNNLQSKCKVLNKDLNDLTLDDFDKPLDIIVCNPPYFKVTEKVKQDISKAMCRHEISTNLEQIISKASKLIKSCGKFYLIVPSSRLCECITLLSQNRFAVKSMHIYNTNSKATVALIEAVKNAKEGVNINIIKEGV